MKNTVKALLATFLLVPATLTAQKKANVPDSVTTLIIVEETNGYNQRKPHKVKRNGARPVNKDKEVKDIDEFIDPLPSAFDEADRVGIIKEVIQEKPGQAPSTTAPQEPILNMAMVEQKPSFPGGDAAMCNWIAQQMIYPAEAINQGLQGKVIIELVVEKDGTITNVRIVRGKHPALDTEAKRIVKAMPKWIPGRNNGTPVRVTYRLPVTFKLPAAN